MELIKQLVELYQTDKRVKQINEAINANEKVQVTGLVGAQNAFVLGGAFLAAPRNHIFITLDKEDAIFLENNLENLLEKKDIILFPDSFKNPMRFEVLDNNNVLQRTEAINKLSSVRSSGELLITYPEALFEKVVAPATLDQMRIEIAVGEPLDVNFLIEVLVDYRFTRSDFVYEPGQFSIRGGIIDIYSYGNNFPYRVELFDDEVESIRTFEPSTQLSTRKISKVSIIPNINTKFKQTQKTSLFKILPENTVLWVEDFELLIERLQNCFDKAMEFAKSISSLDESESAEIFRDRAFIYPNEVIEDLQKFPMVLLGNKTPNFPIQTKVHFNSKPQPSFNKNFNLLIANLTENSSNFFKNYIFTDSVTQIERFYAIFADTGATVDFHPIPLGIHQGFIDKDLKIACYTDHQIFERYHRFRTKTGYSSDQALSIRNLRELQPGDFVTHIDHGVGKFSGLEKINLNGKIQESVRLIYKDRDILYVSINSLHKIAKYVGKDGTEPKLHKLGSDTWKNLKAKTKKHIKDIAEELIKLYAKRKAAVGFSFSPDGYMQMELEASFIYEDTPDQFKATQDVKEDMQKAHPMDRLVCGDVGFGKTEVAIRAAFKAAVDGKQVAILVPTTILALQHFKTFSERLKDFPVTIDYINRFRSAKEKKDILERLEKGSIDIIIGTHSLAGKEVKFKDLGLLIVDEEQKFGVQVKEKLRSIKVNVDTLTLTATPIPRTLQFSLMAARDLSIIRTPPPNRQPIQTEVRMFQIEFIREVIYKEVNRGGQVYFVHNRVQSLPDMVGLLKEHCPDIDIEMAHGQMNPEILERTLVDFIDKKFEVLVCTNIIETGLDIANANTIIINQAHMFGLSDLHQLRGRVGRSNRKAYCYLLTLPRTALPPDSRKRLETIEQFSDIGSGIDVAMRDLDIRGAGNLLGGEQSGFIADIGYHTYQKILTEAIMELKETDFKDVFAAENEKKGAFVQDAEIETDVEMLIPTDYVENTQERLNLYTQVDNIQNEEHLLLFATHLQDRFGKIPDQILEIFDGLRLRWTAKEVGFERVILKDGKLRCYFVLNPQAAYYESDKFKKVLQFINGAGKQNQLSLKQTPKSLIMVRENVRTLQGARRLMELILEKI